MEGIASSPLLENIVLRDYTIGVAKFLVGLFHLLQPRLGVDPGFLHLRFDIVHLLLLGTDNVGEILVNFVHLVHTAVDIPYFFFPLPHNVGIHAILFELELLLLFVVGCGGMTRRRIRRLAVGEMPTRRAVWPPARDAVP